MIPLFKFVLIRVPSWLVHSPCPETPPLPIPPASPLPSFVFACIPVHRGCSCLHLIPLRLIAHAPQTNNQSSIVNNKYSEPLFRPSCRNPILPVFFLSLREAISLALRAALLGQLCKTNPISKSQKLAQPLLRQRLTPIFRPPDAKKTNPNEPNLSRRSLARSRIPDPSSVVHHLSSVVCDPTDTARDGRPYSSCFFRHALRTSVNFSSICRTNHSSIIDFLNRHSLPSLAAGIFLSCAQV